MDQQTDKLNKKKKKKKKKSHKKEGKINIFLFLKERMKNGLEMKKIDIQKRYLSKKIHFF